MSRILLALVLLASPAALALRPVENADHAAVDRAVRDYVEAIYQNKPELIERSVHPALEKIGMYRPDDSKEYNLPGKMTFEQLRALAGKWKAGLSPGAELTYEVQVLDVLDVTASAKLSAMWGVDYMHLVKSGGQWKILQILWQSHPPKS